MEAMIRAAILAVIRGGAAETLDASSSRFAMTTLWAGATAVLAAAALGCGLAALWAWERPILGDAGASLVVSGVLLVGALVAFMVTRRLHHPAKSHTACNASQAMLVAEAGRLFKQHKGSALIAAVLAGLAAERYDREK
jgi:hypothetical protein